MIQLVGETELQGIPSGMYRLEYKSLADGYVDWALRQAPVDQTATWAVYLHGHGATGDQILTRPDVRDQWLTALRKQGWGILAPNLRGNAWMGPAAAHDLHALMECLRRKYTAKRIVLLGGSMGGAGALMFAVLEPQDIDAVIALCPASDIGEFHTWCRKQQNSPPVIQALADAIEHSYGGTPTQNPDVYQSRSVLRHIDRLTMPLFVAHGSNDEVIPVQQSRKLAERMKNRHTFKYHEIAGGNHDSPIGDVEAALNFVMCQVR